MKFRFGSVWFIFLKFPLITFSIWTEIISVWTEPNKLNCVYVWFLNYMLCRIILYVYFFSCFSLLVTKYCHAFSFFETALLSFLLFLLLNHSCPMLHSLCRMQLSHLSIIALYDYLLLAWLYTHVFSVFMCWPSYKRWIFQVK